MKKKDIDKKNPEQNALPQSAQSVCMVTLKK